MRSKLFANSAVFVSGTKRIKRKALHTPLSNLFSSDTALAELLTIVANVRVATVREKYLENEIFSRSGKSQGICG